MSAFGERSDWAERPRLGRSSLTPKQAEWTEKGAKQPDLNGGCMSGFAYTWSASEPTGSHPALLRVLDFIARFKKASPGCRS